MLCHRMYTSRIFWKSVIYAIIMKNFRNCDSHNSIDTELLHELYMYIVYSYTPKNARPALQTRWTIERASDRSTKKITRNWERAWLPISRWISEFWRNTYTRTYTQSENNVKSICKTILILSINLIHLIGRTLFSFVATRVSKRCEFQFRGLFWCVFLFCRTTSIR